MIKQDQIKYLKKDDKLLFRRSIEYGRKEIDTVVAYDEDGKLLIIKSSKGHIHRINVETNLNWWNMATKLEVILYET